MNPLRTINDTFYLVVQLHNELDEIRQHLSRLEGLITKETRVMSAEMDQLRASVARTETAEASAIELIKGLAAQIAASKDDPAALQALADELGAKADALAAAVAENSGAPPATPPTV